MPLNDGYGDQEDLSYLGDPNFKGYVTPTFGNVQEFAAWMAASPSQTPETQRLVQAIRANPNEFEIHGGHFRPKPSFMAKWWPVMVVAAAVAAPAVAGALTGGSGAAAGGAGGTLANTAGTGSAAFNAAMQSTPHIVSQGASAATTAGLLANTAGPGSAAFGAASKSVPQIASQGASTGIPAFTGQVASQTAKPPSGPGDAAKKLFGLKDYLALGLGGASALNGLRQPSANDDLKRMLGLAEDRVESSKPLFDALQRMATSSLPDYARGQ